MAFTFTVPGALNMHIIEAQGENDLHPQDFTSDGQFQHCIIEEYASGTGPMPLSATFPDS